MEYERSDREVALVVQEKNHMGLNNWRYLRVRQIDEEETITIDFTLPSKQSKSTWGVVTDFENPGKWFVWIVREGGEFARKGVQRNWFIKAINGETITSANAKRWEQYLTGAYRWEKYLTGAYESSEKKCSITFSGIPDYYGWLSQYKIRQYNMAIGNFVEEELFWPDGAHVIEIVLDFLLEDYNTEPDQVDSYRGINQYRPNYANRRRMLKDSYKHVEAKESTMCKCWRKLARHLIDLVRSLIDERSVGFGFFTFFIWTFVYGIALFEDDEIGAVLTGELSLCTDDNTFLPIIMVADFVWGCVMLCSICLQMTFLGVDPRPDAWLDGGCTCLCMLLLPFVFMALFLVKFGIAWWYIVDYFTITDSCMNYIQTEGSQFLWGWYLCNLALYCAALLYCCVRAVIAGFIDRSRRRCERQAIEACASM